jgi:phage portal protein BeeE
MSVIQNARNSLGLASSSEQLGEQFYENGLNPSGVLEIPSDAR